jgi:hypothetical protein
VLRRPVPGQPVLLRQGLRPLLERRQVQQRLAWQAWQPALVLPSA